MRGKGGYRWVERASPWQGRTSPHSDHRPEEFTLVAPEAAVTGQSTTDTGSDPTEALQDAIDTAALAHQTARTVKERRAAWTALERLLAQRKLTR